MAARTVDSTDLDWLDMHDLTRWLRMSESTIRRLIASGEFPQPLEITSGTRFWSWRDVLYWQLRVEIRPRLKAQNSQEGSATSQAAPSE